MADPVPGQSPVVPAPTTTATLPFRRVPAPGVIVHLTPPRSYCPANPFGMIPTPPLVSRSLGERTARDTRLNRIALTMFGRDGLSRLAA